MKVMLLMMLFLQCKNSFLYSQDKIMMCDTNIDLKSFEGKTVNDLLSFLKCDSITHSFGTSKPGLLESVTFVFNENFTIKIYIEKYQFLNPFDIKYQWDIEKFKKETIGKVVLVDNGTNR